MSAYIVEDETINKILAYLRFEDDQDCSMLSREYYADLGQQMHNLNCAAFAHRYDERVEPSDFNYRIEPPPNPIQAIKSLNCWLYQCAEGKAPQTGLYKTFAQKACDWAMNYVKNTKDYQDAQWR